MDNRAAPFTGFQRAALTSSDAGGEEFERQMLWLIGGRAVILLLALNLAEPLGVLPSRAGSLPIPPTINLLTVILTVLYATLWWRRWRFSVLLLLQILIDLCLTTFLVSQTRGIESPFVSLYLLIIIYSSLTLGRRGATAASSLSVIFYAGLITAGHLGLVSLGSGPFQFWMLVFRIAFHAFGFIAVAYLGTYLSQRLRVVQAQLAEKIDSVRQLENLNERIISSIRSGLITTDLEGRVTLFNGAAEEMTGATAAGVIGSKLETLLGDGLWARIEQTDLMTSSRPLRHDEWISLAGKRKRCFGYSVSPLMERSSGAAGYIIAFQDLTDFKQLEEEIRLREKMSAIGRMAAGIAHEIRNPLTSIRGSADVLRSRLELPERDARLLDIMVRESDRLNKFVEEFLAFAKPGRHSREPVDLIALLKETSALIENSADFGPDHSLVLKPLSSPVTVSGNPDQLRQVFWNLAQNALRAMPDGGTLVITASAAEDGSANLVFQDNGIGMTPEEKEHLFQPFHSGFTKGTGLGLSIVFQILEDHRAKISYESEKGVGTCVSLSFQPDTPIAAAAAAGR